MTSVFSNVNSLRRFTPLNETVSDAKFRIACRQRQSIFQGMRVDFLFWFQVLFFGTVSLNKNKPESCEDSSKHNEELCPVGLCFRFFSDEKDIE